MNKEIGGEFWTADLSLKSNPINEDFYEFLLAGRTALDFIIKDIKANKKIRSASLPDYCCQSMIEPFLANGVDVDFYEVHYKDRRFCSELDPETSSDVVLVLQYFGSSDADIGKAIKKLQANGKTVIEDATHTWFSCKPYDHSSDYVFASFRKWTGISSGALAVKRKGPFCVTVPSSTNNTYVSVRKAAERLKKRYIEKGIGSKETFLGLFAEAEAFIEQDYRGYGAPVEIKQNILQLNREYIRKTRIANARFLMEILSECPGLEVANLDRNSVPLFIPVIVKNGKRDELQKYLISENVYCPIHWPISKLHKIKNKEIYENVISLVCDQRYTTDDMERIAFLVRNFMGAER